jgi:hypothetical protein
VHRLKPGDVVIIDPDTVHKELTVWHTPVTDNINAGVSGTFFREDVATVIAVMPIAGVDHEDVFISCNCVLGWVGSAHLKRVTT